MKAIMPISSQHMISAATLHEILDFDFAAGKMFWRHRPGASPQWNGRYAGKEAFTCANGAYKQGSIFGRLYLAHRVIYAAAHGEWPDLIDHINQDGGDNSLANLRAADKSANAYNSKVREDNRSGATGVSWFKRKACWRAYVTKMGSQIHLGYFPTIEAAVAARATAFQALVAPAEPRR